MCGLRAGWALEYSYPSPPSLKFVGNYTSLSPHS